MSFDYILLVCEMYTGTYEVGIKKIFTTFDNSITTFPLNSQAKLFMIQNMHRVIYIIYVFIDQKKIRTKLIIFLIKDIIEPLFEVMCSIFNNDYISNKSQNIY